MKDVINYDYDVNGNIICIKYLKGKTRFFYDELNRLIREDNIFCFLFIKKWYNK